MLDIPNMFVSRASITAANVHHLVLGPEYWLEQQQQAIKVGSHYGSL